MTAAVSQGASRGPVGAPWCETSIGTLGYETSSTFDSLSSEVSHYERSVRDRMTIKIH
jgi:hypothetical protein